MTDTPNDKAEPVVSSKYAMVMAVAKRAKQIREGSPKLVDIKSKNPITIAMHEIAAGAVSMRVPTQEEMEAAERLESIPKTSGAREAAELLKITEEEAEPEGVAEMPVETVPTEGAEPGAESIVPFEAEPEAEEAESEDEEESEEVESEDETEEPEEVEEEETPAEEDEEQE